MRGGKLLDVVGFVGMLSIISNIIIDVSIIY